MNKTHILLSLTGAALLCGCDKQTKINSEKTQMLSQNIIQFEQNQAKQMAAIQSQLTSLAPRLDQMNSSYFAKNRDDEFFYHTNRLYLLLMVDKKIEAHLQVADTKSEAEGLGVFLPYQRISPAEFYATQIQDAMTSQESRMRDDMAGQESRIEAKVNAETRQVGTNLSDELQTQLKLLALDADETARRKEMAADVAQIKRELEQIKAQLGQMTNLPAIRP